MSSLYLAATTATIAAKAARHDSELSVAECASFAIFSIGQDGDASIDDVDFLRHYDVWQEFRPINNPGG